MADNHHDNSLPYSTNWDDIPRLVVADSLLLYKYFLKLNILLSIFFSFFKRFKGRTHKIDKTGHIGVIMKTGSPISKDATACRNNKFLKANKSFDNKKVSSRHSHPFSQQFKRGALINAGIGSLIKTPDTRSKSNSKLKSLKAQDCKLQNPFFVNISIFTI